MSFYPQFSNERHSLNTAMSSPLTISREIWFAFLEEFSHWKKKDIYTISFFLEFDYDTQEDIRLLFGYNTESHYQSERCRDTDDREVRWNYEYWLQNELFCFGEDGLTHNMIDTWLKQQHIPKHQSVERFNEQLVYAVQDIHRSQILTHRFGREIPIIIHNRYYYSDIAFINMEANGDCLPLDFIEYCMSGTDDVEKILKTTKNNQYY